MLTAAHLPEIQGAYENLPMAAATADDRLRIQWLNPDAARRFAFLKLPDGVQSLLYPSSPSQVLPSLRRGESVSLACGVPPAVGCTVSLLPAMQDGVLKQVLFLIADGFCAGAPLREPGLASGMLFSRLRANLAICLGVTQTLKKQGGSREHGVYLDILDNRCQCLLRELQNLSALSRFLQGASQPALLYKSLTVFLEELLTACNALLSPLGRSIRCHMPAGGICTQICTQFDEDTLSLAMLNLLSNALLYGDQTAEVFVRETGGRVLLEVRNRSAHLGRDTLLRMFDPFYAFHPAGPSHAGSGIGLTVAKLTALSHQGTAFAEHTDGTTRLYLTLPLHRETRPPHPCKTAAAYLENRLSLARVMLANVTAAESPSSRQ